MKIDPNIEIVTLPALKIADFISGYESVIWPIIHEPGAQRLSGFQRRHLFETTKIDSVTFLRTKNESADKITDRRMG